MGDFPTFYISNPFKPVYILLYIFHLWYLKTCTLEAGCPNAGPQEAWAAGGAGEEGNKGFPGEKPDWRGDTARVI